MARWQITILVTCIALAIGACIGVSMRESETSGDRQAADIRPIEKGDEYVAMGDSYTAAPWTGPSTDDCFQSTTNYPHKIAERLGLKLKDVSCSGASTSHVTTPQVIGSTRRPPQADALSRGTDVVTISLGANDFDTFGTVAFGCTALRFDDPSGAPCKAADAEATGKTVAQKTRATEEHVVDTIRLVAERAPAARIVVVGYPEFFPAAGPCTQLPLALGDYPFAHRVNELIVRSLKRAAARAKVTYLEVFTPTQGHDMCAKDPWIAGVHPTRTDAAPWHPYPEEQQLVADLLVDLLTAASPSREQSSGR